MALKSSALEEKLEIQAHL